MPVISILILVNSAYLGTKSVKIFELKLLKSSIYFLVKMFIYALFYLDLLTSQYIPLSVDTECCPTTGYGYVKCGDTEECVSYPTILGC